MIIKKYNEYIKENNIVYSSDEVDPYGEEDWDDGELTPVLRVARKQGLPYDQITYLDCHNKDLNSLEGIEKLINLNELRCYENKLRNLKGIENLINLEHLYCHVNNLTSLEGVENLVNLKNLYCGENKLRNLNGIENLINLKYFACPNNNLKSLDGIENLINLKDLRCYENKYPHEYEQYLIKYCRNKKIRLYAW